MEALRPGDPRRAGSYRLIARLGEGGMGRVFLGRSGRGRMVAVKLVHAEFARDAEFRRRFRHEVEAARKVGGEWTAAVLDADTESGAPWVATAYVPGPTLQEVVDLHGPLPEASALALAAGLARALRAVHGHDLIHRDLKPSNVLVTIDGPRVIDFGVARSLDSSMATRTGSLIGSPGFMSPEQARGEALTPASDIFSLGSVLAYAATGRRPFGAGDSGVHAQLLRVTGEPADLGDLAGPVRDLVDRCLAKEPGDRPGLDELAGDPPGDGTWLPAGVVAELGRHAARLLDLEDPDTDPEPPTELTPPPASAPEPEPEPDAEPVPDASARPPAGSAPPAAPQPPATAPAAAEQAPAASPAAPPVPADSASAAPPQAPGASPQAPGDLRAHPAPAAAAAAQPPPAASPGAAPPVPPARTEPRPAPHPPTWPGPPPPFHQTIPVAGHAPGSPQAAPRGAARSRSRLPLYLGLSAAAAAGVIAVGLVVALLPTGGAAPGGAAADGAAAGSDVPAGMLGGWEHDTGRIAGTGGHVRRITVEQGGVGAQILTLLSVTDDRLCSYQGVLRSVGSSVGVDLRGDLSVPEGCMAQAKADLTLVGGDLHYASDAGSATLTRARHGAIPDEHRGTWEGVVSGPAALDGPIRRRFELTAGGIGTEAVTITGVGGTAPCEGMARLVSAEGRMVIYSTRLLVSDDRCALGGMQKLTPLANGTLRWEDGRGGRSILRRP